MIDNHCMRLVEEFPNQHGDTIALYLLAHSLYKAGQITEALKLAQQAADKAYAPAQKLLTKIQWGCN